MREAMSRDLQLLPDHQLYNNNHISSTTQCNSNLFTKERDGTELKKPVFLTARLFGRTHYLFNLHIVQKIDVQLVLGEMVFCSRVIVQNVMFR